MINVFSFTALVRLELDSIQLEAYSTHIGNGGTHIGNR